MERQVRIHDLNVKYQVSRRDVRYPRLEFKTGRLLLVLPRNYKNEKEVIKRHEDWIYNKSILIRKSLGDVRGKALELKRSDSEFRNIIHSSAKIFSSELKVDLNKIFFRKMKSKWGSCSSRKNLTLNTLLKYLPKNLIEYIVFHEMIHVRERKHNERFWKAISKKYKNYRKYESALMAYWFLIQRTWEVQNT